MQSAIAESVAPDLPDVEIAQRVAADDWDTLRRLMRRHNQTLYRTARSILKDDAEAEDAVQEAYLARVSGDGELSRRREAVDLARAHRRERGDRPRSQA